MLLRFFLPVICLSLCCLHLTAAIASDSAQQPTLTAADLEFFEAKIRPMLVEHCYECHSEEALAKNKLKGGLLLDSPAGILKGGDSGPAVVVGEVEESLLIESLRYEAFEMPPDGQLSRNVIHDFEEWIKRGMPDPRTVDSKPGDNPTFQIKRDHWSYRPIVAPQPPLGPRTESHIDQFIVARLSESDLQLNDEAGRAILIRRLYFDLTGLPPTPEEVDAFVQDEAPDAYPRLVDRLLASPRFGERWGRHWLDVARFAESITLRGFVLPQAWRYRDFVIESFNQDRRFDEFLRKQIAGDLIPTDSVEERQQNLIATGYLTLGNTNLEDQDKQKLRMDVVDEQLGTIGRGILAQTITCARCHDHKFDPIPTLDYYALAGILRSTRTLTHANVSKWLELPLPLETELEEAYLKREEQVAALQSNIKRAKARLGKSKAVTPVAKLNGIVLDDSQAEYVGSWTQSTAIATYIGDGYRHDSNTPNELKTATFRPQINAPGDYEIRFAYTHSSNRAAAAAVTVYAADGSHTVRIDQRKAPSLDGHFVSLGVHRLEPNSDHRVVASNRDAKGTLIVDAVQFLSQDDNAKPVRTTSPPTVDQEELAQQLAQLEADLEVAERSLPARSVAMSVEEEDEIGDTRIHIRGNVHNLGSSAPRGFLSVISSEPSTAFTQEQSGRVQLADWLASASNPLPPRVYANRVWHWLFGAGLVRTTDNFGSVGERPSHPQLLDYLAWRLRDGWSVKELVREIVLSQAYRQSSQVPPEKAALSMSVDPENRLLWKMNRRRKDAEGLLDSMLQASGTLDLEIGGNTIRKGVKADYDYEHTGLSRRAVYWPVMRNALPRIFEVFDFPNPSMVVGRRDESSSAPQALFMLNNPFVVECAEQAAANLLAEQFQNQAEQVSHVFLQVLGRLPETSERQTVNSFLGEELTQAQQLEAWTQVYQTLFGSLDFRHIP